MTLKCSWKLVGYPFTHIGFTIAQTVTGVVHEQMPDLLDMFSLCNGNWELQGHLDEEWLAVRITGRPGQGLPLIGDFKEREDLEYLRKQVLPFVPRPHSELCERLGSQWFSFDRFTYVGPYAAPCACRQDLNQHLLDWLNQLVLPEVLRRNQARVLRAIPQPPQFALETVRQACWVLECEESCLQGTAFAMADVGLVTCQHVLGPSTKAFKAESPSQKYPVELLSQNKTIDLAVLRLAQEAEGGLAKGSGDALNVMDHLLLYGFPNYAGGDTGVSVPGLVIGFRMVSGIRRILTNAPIVRGSSGGPVLGAGNLVVGVAVTGAERMESAQDTEKHGIIPIDALQHLLG